MKEYFEIYAWSECPYCVKAKELLIEKEKQFMFCCIDESKELLSYIKDKYNWMTVPMIIKKRLNGEFEFIGGFSDLQKYFQQKTEDNSTKN